jgi:CDP-diacylglycerol---glycerol-3-phosphate 3-phosphatidyltransferase
LNPTPYPPTPDPFFMSTAAERTRSVRRPLGKVFNLPNQLTSLRLLLSVVLFGLIALEYYVASFILFVIAAGTDWLDGYYARKYGQVTTLGRILDPFADKVIICGTLIFLAMAPAMLVERWGLRAWMIVVIVGRELLVTALRSFIEERGANFSANMSGKLKMVLQCVAAGACLVYLHCARVGLGSMPRDLAQEVQSLEHARMTAGLVQGVPVWVWWAMVISVWSAVMLTIYSGVVYIFVAVKLLHQE